VSTHTPISAAIAALEAPTRPSPPSPPPAAVGGARHVLLVDDSETNRLVLAGQLLTWEIQADLAEDAVAALEHLRDAASSGRPYDVVVVDLLMPGTDGFELAAAVRSEPALCSPRMLLLSSAPVDPLAARRAGFSAWLTKPARRSQLYDAFVRMRGRVTASATVPGTSAGAGPARGRLLVVEDNAINQAVARGLVTRLGYACDVAGNGLEALDAVERRAYDAVLMDCQMPELDGFEATAEIRRREDGGRRVPIIAMTAGALVEDRERCLAAGMDDYLPKPVKRRELEAVLSRWLAPAVPALPGG
jgi:CheY-like chemotaxis protein